MGSIGLTVAARARQVIGVEIMPEAVADAARNAAANGVAHYRAICGDVGRVVRELRDELPRADVAIVDPPRGGLSGRAIRRVLDLAPSVLVYVSCHPATFAENAAKFVAAGYDLEYVQPVDMFPNTPHIEAVARFVRDEVRVSEVEAAAARAAAAEARRAARAITDVGDLVGRLRQVPLAKRSGTPPRRRAWPIAHRVTRRCRGRRSPRSWASSPARPPGGSRAGVLPGNLSELIASSASAPIGMISFGMTICSSRVNHWGWKPASGSLTQSVP